MLVVDDDPVSRSALCDLVAAEGFSCRDASGGAQALQVLASEPVDLVLLDLAMPDVDGLAVLAGLGARQALPALPVVIVTADGDHERRVDALAAGAIDVLTKPVDRFELGCKLRALGELRRLRAVAAARVEKAAAAEQLARVERAVAGLPLVIYETQVDPTPVDGPALFKGNWTIGDREGVLGVGTDFTDPDQWLQKVHPDDRKRLEADLRHALDGSKPSYSSRLRLQVGSEYRWLHHAASYDGATRTLRGMVLNIDEQVNLEEQFRQSQKMEAIGMLAGGVAHDFNNLLSVILAYGGFVRDALPEGDERRNDVMEVLHAGERAAELTQQLLTFSRQAPSVKRAIDLNENLTELRKLLARTVGEHIVLTIVTSPKPAMVLIDPVQFDQIALNLAVNARDAMPQGGRLRIELDEVAGSSPESADERWVRLKVTDTGVGMDERTRQRVFDPFFTTKPKGKGTGLGLATCFGIVADAGGTIEVQSAPGKGATFIVQLPRFGGSRSVLPAIDHDDARPGDGEHVLLAEDEPALRKVTTRLLERAGYVVHVATDGPEAMRKIDELGARLEVIVSDVVMPGCSGYDVVEHALRALPGIGVVLMSGYLDDTVAPNRRSDLPVLWKPVAPQALLHAVARALEATGSAEATGAAGEPLDPPTSDS